MPKAKNEGFAERMAAARAAKAPKARGSAKAAKVKEPPASRPAAKGQPKARRAAGILVPSDKALGSLKAAVAKLAKAAGLQVSEPKPRAKAPAKKAARRK